MVFLVFLQKTRFISGKTTQIIYSKKRDFTYFIIHFMAKEKKQVSMEEKLWQSANKLRGSVEASEYKHVVLGLIFLKFASDKFE